MSQIATPFTKSFLEGFFTKCAQAGMSGEDTEAAFRVHAHNTLLSQPSVYQGFANGLKSCSVSKAKMARVLNPEAISAALDCVIRFGDSVGARETRKLAGMPEPSWDQVEPGLRKVASTLHDVIGSFARLPLHQQVLLSMLAGGVGGGLVRGLKPHDSDLMEDRGILNRMARGAVHGAGTGAGTSLGASLGADIYGGIDRNPHTDGQVASALGSRAAGGLAGGMAASHVMDGITG